MTLAAEGPAPPAPQPSRAWPGWVDPAALAAVFLALTITTWGAWPDVLVDFGRELYTAWRLSAGDVLYRDVASFYGPFSPYLNAALFRVSGVSLRTLVVFNLAILAGTTLLLRALLLRAGTGRATAAAAAAVFLGMFGFGHLIANGSFNFVCPYAHEATHGFALGLSALLCVLRFADAPRWPLALASGLLCGLTFLTKPEPFVAALGSCALVLLLAKASGRRQRIRRLAAFAAGLAGPPLVVFGLLATAMPPEEAWRGTLGSWAYLGHAELRSMGYFGWSAGLDHPLQHLRALAGASAVQAAFLLPALGLAWALRGKPHAARWVAVAAAAAVAAVLAPSWGSRAWLRAARPLTPWSVGLLAASAAGLWRARARDAFPSILARTALAAFALLLLPRVLLNARFFHYGFVLSAAATVLVVAALLDWIPRALDHRGAAGGVFRAAAAAGLLFVVASAVRDSHTFMERKQVAVGRGWDRFRADPRGQFVGPVLENVDRVSGQGTLVVLPEGAMINYLLRRPSSIPYLTMLPTDEATFGEDELLGSLQRRPPTLIALVHRTTDEFGTPLFGRDYAQRTRAWIDAHYTSAFTVGDPPLERGANFGIRILKHRDVESLR